MTSAVWSEMKWRFYSICNVVTGRIKSGNSLGVSQAPLQVRCRRGLSFSSGNYTLPSRWIFFSFDPVSLSRVSEMKEHCQEKWKWFEKLNEWKSFLSPFLFFWRNVTMQNPPHTCAFCLHAETTRVLVAKKGHYACQEGTTEAYHIPVSNRHDLFFPRFLVDRLLWTAVTLIHV